MRNLFAGLLFVAATLFAPAAYSLNLFACEPEWAALAQELGVPPANIYTATNAQQDPHRIEARPSLIARARRADLLVCTGAELELAWLPVVLRESGNVALTPGKPGHFEAASYVSMLEIPTRLDRADGDVHPGGNPHLQLDPRNFLPIAQALAQRLSELDPANAASYQQHQTVFRQNWQAAIARWERQAAPLRGVPVLVQHKAFPYLENWLGLKEIAALEPKPGLEPSAAHLSQLLAQLQQRPAKLLLRAAYQNPKPAEWMSQHAQLAVAVLPFTVGGNEAAKDLYGLFDDTVARLLTGLK
ncbi:MAG: zinc ABC transporter substrate-binding protein [Nitrosomonadales bacterium]|nr:zinc ABC transporter substrate-binding protein [Nitrosomonadales bacterium]